ncbi:MAG: hypothetical protein A2W72_11490 [Burkholderiales bacterium RIFCSPLOWO2_12_67_14]|nr:MAG: hypothetical protein A2W72_11490 [Burkholderiales bacterium RIFCSPLOWO2_12_67_14]OGB48581.1 MAG: hypothetical protein A3E51_03850 [Burkholderiales bacterium RIFCSPHIGHO2_12_FULL_67_38]
MLGGLMTLAGLALADVLGNRSIGSARNLMFVVVTGSACVVMTGLPEVFFPALPEQLLRVLKAGLGPLAGAMGLYFVGTWLGGVREDGLVHRLTTFWGVVLAVVALALALLASQTDREHFRPLLIAAAAVNMVPVLMALVAVIRAAQLGDPMARWMALAIVCLGAMVSSHYLHGLKVPGLGLGTQLFTATVTVAFFLIASVLGLLRNRQNRLLARLSRLQAGADPATALPTGSALLSHVEHAFWRTARQQNECSVVCLYLSNLYELAESAGAGVEHQILVTVAARIHRAAGFRCVVGLYHPRCFVVVISADRHQPPVGEVVARLRSMVAQPLTVQSEKLSHHAFLPHLGIGVVTLDPSNAKPMDVLNEAERQALAKVRGPERAREHDITTAPAPLG